MKQLYILFFLMFSLGYSRAQMVEVTFQVDANELALTKKIFSKGIHVVGGFQGWDPAKTPMSDPEGDGTWTFTTMIENGTQIEYKFNNSDSWNGNDEANNRKHTVTDNGNGKDIIPLVCFNQDGPCTNTGVTVRVDMNDEIIKNAFNPATDSVTIAGSFQGWNAGSHRMADPEGDGIYSINLSLMDGSYEYKFVKNGGTWEGGISGNCVNGGGNRVMNVLSNSTLPTYCFNSCEDCKLTGPPKRIQVTFRVNMNNMIKQFGKVDTCYVAGSFQGWTPGKATSALLDPDGDGIYEGRDSVDGKSSYEFKYLYGSAWGYDETGLSGLGCATGGGNRKIEVGETDTTLVAYCFNTCDDGCAPLPDKIKVRFKLDLSSEIPSADGIFIKSSFQWPQFKHEVTPLTLIDPAKGIFATEVLDIIPIRQDFKFVNGKTDNDQENAKFKDLGCGVINPVGEHLRSIDFTGLTDFQDVGFVWNTCDKLTATSEEYLDVDFRVYPNPMHDQAVLYFNPVPGDQYHLSIRSIFGTQVLELSNLRQSRQVVKNDDLGSGIFIVTLTNQKGAFVTTKLVVR